MKSLIFLGMFAFCACNGISQEKADQPGFVKTWETDSVMTTAESVLYDPGSKSLYVSNIHGDPSAKDNNGFISKLYTDGSVKSLKWATGLHAPKGMAIRSGKLYVSDIDALVELDLTNGKITGRYPIKDAVFLNDVATDGKKVLVSDSQKGTIHALENGKISLWKGNQKSVNGLAFDTSGIPYSLDQRGLVKHSADGKQEDIINGVVTNGDGIIILDDKNFVVSRWQGEIYKITNGKEHLLLDTKGEKSNTADLGYIPDQNLVLVPTFFKNKVVAYKLDEKSH